MGEIIQLSSRWSFSFEDPFHFALIETVGVPAYLEALSTELGWSVPISTYKAWRQGISSPPYFVLQAAERIFKRFSGSGDLYPVAQWITDYPSETAPVLDNDVNRRKFVQSLTVTGLEMLDPELLAAALDVPKVVTERLFNDLEALTNEYGRLYWGSSPSGLWPSVQMHLAVVRRLMETTPPKFSRRAAAIGSQTASLAGMLTNRRGKRHEARMYFALAEEYAAESGEGWRRAEPLIGMRSLCSATSTDPAHAQPAKALSLLDEAVEAAGAAAPQHLLTWLYASRAEDHAVLGNQASCMQDIEAAHSALNAAGVQKGTFFYHWDEMRLNGYAGSCALLLGNSEEALRTLEKTSKNTPESLIGPRVAILTDLGSAYAQKGEIEHACSIFADVASLCERAGRLERLDRMSRARDRWLSRWQDNPSVRRLNDQVAQLQASNVS